MEFKEFKNSTGKILKEYWLTQSEWDALDKTTVQEGDIYHIVGTIDKGDLSADVNASLAKGDSSLQKPTTTLAKESFVKVGIDGTQKFDESSYVIAPSTGGTAGQVLKKTEAGTEWADESGGGGGKLYLHNLSIFVPDSSQAQLKIINTDSSKITSVTDELLKIIISGLAAPSFPPSYSNIQNIALLDGYRLSMSTYNNYPFDVTHTHNFEIDLNQAVITDKVTEL